MKILQEILKTVLISTLAGAVVAALAAFLISAQGLLLALFFVTGFCIAVTAHSTFKMAGISTRMVQVDEGLRAYERSMGKRIDALSDRMPTLDRVERLERKITGHSGNLHVATENIVARNALTDEEELQDFRSNVANIEDSSNVVLLHRSSEAQTQKDEVSVFNPFKKPKFSATDLQLRLQPAICLGSQEISSFEVLMCLPNDLDEIYDDQAVRAMLKTTKDRKEFDRAVCDQAFSTIRTLLRQGKSPEIFIPVSGATLSSKQTFKEFLEILKSQRKLAKNITWEIDQQEFEGFSSRTLEALREILELDYTLCLSNCVDQDAAADALREGFFKVTKMPIQQLEGTVASGSTLPASELMVACGKTNTQLIVTGVERESQTMRLFDYDVRFAQGNFFSEPKFPNIGQASDIKTGKNTPAP